MSKLPSEATQIRNLKRDANELREELWRIKNERDHHSAKAHMLQIQVQEWKDRFDTLLRACKVTVNEEVKKQ